MADIITTHTLGLPMEMAKRYKDMGDGSYAEIFAVAGATAGMAMSLYNVATNGDLFPADSATTYEYDASGINILSISKTTNGNVVYKQTWARNGSGQLSSKSGWVKQ